MRRFRNLAAFTIVLTLAACGGGEQPSSAPRTSAYRPAQRPTQPQQRVASEASFIAENGSFDLFAIRASELAIQRSSSPRIRDFARTIIADHKGTSGQLSLQGRRLNLLPSATLLPIEQAMLDSLQASTGFDAEYVRGMRKLHQQAVARDSAYSANGQSPTLRPVAASALRIEQRHLRLLAYL